MAPINKAIRSVPPSRGGSQETVLPTGAVSTRDIKALQSLSSIGTRHLMRQPYFPPLLIRLQYGQANFQGRFAPPSVMRHWLIRRDGFTEIFELYFERPLPLR